MRILVIIDVYGWAFEFFACGWQRYSAHTIDYKCRGELTQADIKQYDCFFVMNKRNYDGCSIKPPPYKTVLGVRSACSSDVCIKSNDFAGIVANSTESQEMAQRHTSKQVHYLRSAVDAEIFTRTKPLGTEFGWSGDPSKPRKRVQLLGRIDHEIMRKADHGSNFFVRGRTRTDQVAFYNSLLGYIHVSNSEGLSQTILEAAACALPIIACNAGDNDKIIDKAYWLPMDENKCRFAANELILRFKVDRELAHIVGQQNRNKITEGWTWKQRAVEYDKLIEEMICH